MVIFSAYTEELPQHFNPFNLRHCLLLAFWIYFRPTLLKSYLYQLDPEFYWAKPGLKVFRTFKIPGYRNLYLTALNASLLLSSFFSIIGLLILPVVFWLTDIKINYFYNFLSWISGIITGTATGIVFFPCLLCGIWSCGYYR